MTHCSAQLSLRASLVQVQEVNHVLVLGQSVNYVHIEYFVIKQFNVVFFCTYSYHTCTGSWSIDSSFPKSSFRGCFRGFGIGFSACLSSFVITLVALGLAFVFGASCLGGSVRPPVDDMLSCQRCNNIKQCLLLNRWTTMGNMFSQVSNCTFRIRLAIESNRSFTAVSFFTTV